MPQTTFPTADRTSPPTCPEAPQPLWAQSAILHLLTPFTRCWCHISVSISVRALPIFLEVLAGNCGVSHQKSTESCCMSSSRQPAMARGREGNNTPTALMALSLGQGTGAQTGAGTPWGENCRALCTALVNVSK